jgi:hypothetical protein
VIVKRLDEDAFVLTDPTHGIEFHVDHLRRDRHELVGELRVACGMLDDVAELAAGLPLWDRIRQALRRSPQTLAVLAEELNAKPDSLDRIVRRHKNLFKKITGSDGIHRIALVERQAS